MATILRPPLVSQRQPKRNLGAVFAVPNLLVTTLIVVAGATLPPGKQLHASAPAPKRTVQAEQFVPSQDQLNFVWLNAVGIEDSAPRVKPSVRADSYPNLLANTLKPVSTALALPLNAERWEDSAPIIRKDVSCWQQPSVLVRGINPNARIAQLTDSAPARRQVGDIDPQPSLLQTTLAPAQTALALPLNAERWEDSAPQPNAPVYAVQQHNLLILGINPNAAVASLYQSAPPPKVPVVVEPPPNLLTTTLYVAPASLGLPLNAGRLDQSAPRVIPPVRVELLSRPVTLGINPNSQVQGLTASAPPPKYSVQVDRYPNLQLNTLLGSPVGKVLSDSSPPPKFEVMAEQYVNYALLGYPVLQTGHWIVHPSSGRIVYAHRGRTVTVGS